MVALLYFLDEYSCQEIADCVGVPAGTVRPPPAPESAAHAEDVWTRAWDQGRADSLLKDTGDVE